MCGTDHRSSPESFELDCNQFGFVLVVMMIRSQDKGGGDDDPGKRIVRVFTKAAQSAESGNGWEF